MRYAWIITEETTFDEPGVSISSHRVAKFGFLVAGPRGVDQQLIANAQVNGREFVMRDEDRLMMIKGRIWTDGDAGTATDFAPLDDYGTPGLGCTEILYDGKTL